MKLAYILPLVLLAVIALACVLPPLRNAISEAAHTIAHGLHAQLRGHMARQGLLLTMTALAANTPRAFELGNRNHLPVKATTKIYEGSCVGIVAASGYARPAVTTDLFAGFAVATADNSANAVDGAINVEVQVEGEIVLAVTGVVITSFRAPVYASDDNTFTTTAGSNVFVGYVKRYISNGNAVVAFSAINSSSAT